jgi:hypothetical protein
MPYCKRVLVLVVLFGFSTIAAVAADNASANPDSPVAASTPTAGSDYFSVSPSISAPGQFVEFSWRVADAVSFSVAPSLLSEDEEVLPVNASNHAQVAPLESTVFQAAAARSGGQRPTTLSTALTIVPVTVSVSSENVAAGHSVAINFSAGKLDHTAHR